MEFNRVTVFKKDLTQKAWVAQTLSIPKKGQTLGQALGSHLEDNRWAFLIGVFLYT